MKKTTTANADARELCCTKRIPAMVSASSLECAGVAADARLGAQFRFATAHQHTHTLIRHSRSVALRGDRVCVSASLRKLGASTDRRWIDYYRPAACVACFGRA